MQLSLGGAWDLYYHLEQADMPQTLEEVRAANWPRIDAQVPGNVELDLVRAGIEQDPFYAENVYDYRKYEYTQWWFTRTVHVPKGAQGRWTLRFEGMNTFATVYVNDIEVGRSENMFIEHEFDVRAAIRPGEVNRVTVRIESALNKARNMDYPAMLSEQEFSQLRMPPHSFGWDIAPRLLSAGMWRGVSLVCKPATRITEVYYATRRIEGQTAVLHFAYQYTTDADMLDDYSIRLTGTCGEDTFVYEQPALFTRGEGNVSVREARLWWPRGYGEQPLYQVKLELLRAGEVVDTREETIGLRLIRLEQKMLSGDAGEFKVHVNGCPILCKGSNWVPLDAMHSRDADRVAPALALFAEMGCNIVRCWGGNVYEDHAFFDLCDQYGLLVWQDFAMACNTYLPTPAFSQVIEQEAVAVIKKLRNHASILLWAGDNEVDERYSSLDYPTDANCYNAITREVLPRAVRMHDPYRVFLPSSPYIPDGIIRYQVPEQHNWGARAYFKDDFYKHSTAHFISEVGYHGCNSPASLRKFIPEDKLWPRLGNTVWDTHNTDYLPAGPRGYNRIQLMTDQVEILFGEVPDDLAAFSLLSQISQAEAKKFFVERTRLLKWRRTGVIWWNMLDCWPQISDAIVDYYFDRKLAFSYLKRVHEPVCLMMDELVGWTRDVVLGNDSRESHLVRYEVTDADTGETLLLGEVVSLANENVKVGQVRELAGTKKLYILRWWIDDKAYANHYLAGFPTFDAEQVCKWVDIIKELA